MSKAKVKVRSYFDRVRVRTPVNSKKDPSQTEQHHARSCDINTIMAKFQKTGLIEWVNQKKAVYADVTAADWAAAQNIVAAARTQFEELPSYVRKQFSGVEEYLELVQTDEGVERLRQIVHPAQNYEKDGSPGDPGKSRLAAPEEASEGEKSGQAA